MIGVCSRCAGPFDSSEIGSSVVRQCRAGERHIEVFYLCAACTVRERTLTLPQVARLCGPDAPEHIDRFVRQP